MLKNILFSIQKTPSKFRGCFSEKIISPKMQFSCQKVSVQLDYFVNTQFAGLALAKAEDMYEKRGISLSILPECLPGEEPQHVRDHYDTTKELCVGTIEQNVFVPVMAKKGPQLNLRAVAAMFARSPLALAALPTHPFALKDPSVSHKVGAHEDTVDLIQKLLPKATVISVAREKKMEMLRSGELDSVQVYDVMETLMLQHELGVAPRVVPLERLGAHLGYSQVMFAPAECLQDKTHLSLLQAFLDVTFEGWHYAIKNPREAAKAVRALQAEMGVTSDHWIDTLEFAELSVQHCCDYVKAGSRGGKLGVMDVNVWGQSTKWLSHVLPGSRQGVERAIFDPSVWKEDKKLMFGKGLADSIREQTRSAAALISNTSGQAPSLAVITVGSEPLGGTHKEAARRLALFSPQDVSWYSKKLTGEALGITVEEINLPQSITTEELVQEIRKHVKKDGIQLMWPLPDHIDAKTAYASIPEAQDIDGAHYIGRIETAGGHKAVSAGVVDPFQLAPVTPVAVIRLLQHYSIGIQGKKITVIGRSRIVGQPLAYMLTSLGALVTLSHSGIPNTLTEAACKVSDIVISCTGSPFLVKGDWVKPGAVVFNVGTALDGDLMLTDTTDIKDFEHASLIATSPGGVGPLSVAVLFENVVKQAMNRKATK